MRSKFIELIEQLNIANAECIYLHFAAEELGGDFSMAKNFLDIFIDYFGKNVSLFMPTYTFGPTAEYIQLINQEQITFDSILSPCRLNLIGEIFRRKSNSIRSLNPLLPVSGIGPLAEKILSSAHLDEMPFGPYTAYNQLNSYKTYVVGVGVTIQVNSFIHVIDDLVSALFPFPIYSDKPVKAKLLKNKNQVHSGYYYYVLPEIRRKMNPVKIHEYIEDESFYRYIDSPFNAYSVELSGYLQSGEKIAREAFNVNDLPPWYKPVING